MSQKNYNVRYNSQSQIQFLACEKESSIAYSDNDKTLDKNS